MLEMGKSEMESTAPAQLLDSGLCGLSLVAGYYRIAGDPMQLRHQLALTGRRAQVEDVVRGANVLRLKSRILRGVTAKRLGAIPFPAILSLKDGGFAVLGAGSTKGMARLVDPIARTAQELSMEDIAALSSGELVLITRRFGGAGVDPTTFGFRWFWPSILRYRRSLTHVLVASLFVQLFALATPIFFQLVVDKVLVHKGLSTLIVLVIGMVTLGLFETILQFLRTYTLSHTTNRIDVELGRRLFHHLFRLPLAYFETRPAGQTVARMRELETIRSFLTGQGLTSLLDLVFTLIFFVVMFIYSEKLTLVVLASIPVYIVIASLIRPVLREQTSTRSSTAALGSAAIPGRVDCRRSDPQGGERRANDAGAVGGAAGGLRPHLRQRWRFRSARAEPHPVCEQDHDRVDPVCRRAIGDRRDDDGRRTHRLQHDRELRGAADLCGCRNCGGDFQQVQVSVARLGDILNAPPEPVPQNLLTLPPLRALPSSSAT